jgi:hypothetical protein
MRTKKMMRTDDLRIYCTTWRLFWALFESECRMRVGYGTLPAGAAARLIVGAESEKWGAHC